MSTKAQQLPLALSFPDAARLDNFIVGPNAEVLASLQQIRIEDADHLVCLWGEPASGKTHLLQALCMEASAGAAVCLPMGELRAGYPVSVLEGMESVPLVCLDDINAIAGDATWEKAVFVLFNRIRDAGGALVFSSSVAPAQLDIDLPDLRSRLSWGLVLHLRALDDAGKAQALQRRAAWRGLELPAEVVDFLLHRCSRSLADLMQMLETLDTASLVHSRRLTIPFVKQALSL